MNALDIGRIALGLVVLVGGGELLVRGASALAARWGLSRLVVGLTVVAVGTSAPEFAVTVGAVLRDETDLAVGNVVGSNIANVLLILGLAAVVLPLAVKAQLVRVEVPAMIVFSGVFLLCALDGRVSTLDGLLLLGLWLAHTTVTVVLSRRDTAPSTARRDQVDTPDQRPPEPTQDGSSTGDSDSGAARPPKGTLSVLLIAAGIALLVAGANLLVTGAVNTATSLGVDGLVIGLTVVAVGTSLPELVTSMVAAIRGESDIAIGNVVGSCIANIGLVLAVPVVFSGGGIPVAPAAIALDIPLMVATALVVLPIVFTGFTVQRWEGALFVALYVAYATYLVLNATGHQALTGFTQTMVFFVLPLIVVTLITTLVHDLHRRATRHNAPAEPKGEAA
ncbi:MAG: calcium/sodium antiporter [Candidatus Nanopelagicales bacterium]